MRTILGCVAVLVLACGATAAGQTKIDAKKIVGKWEPAPDKDKKPVGMVIEFTDKGKVIVALGEYKAEGSYRLESDKLTVKVKIRDQENNETLTVRKLTDDELVTEDSKSRAETLKRKR